MKKLVFLLIVSFSFSLQAYDSREMDLATSWSRDNLIAVHTHKYFKDRFMREYELNFDDVNPEDLSVWWMLRNLAPTSSTDRGKYRNTAENLAGHLLAHGMTQRGKSSGTMTITSCFRSYPCTMQELLETIAQFYQADRPVRPYVGPDGVTYPRGD